MLDIKIEYRKGILFIRLFGKLNNKTSKDITEKIVPFIKENGIKFIVYNIEGLEYINIEGIKALKENSSAVYEGGKVLVCGIKNNLVKNRIDNSSLLKYMYETSNELSAFNIIKL